MSSEFQFVHQFPEHPSERTFLVDGRLVSAATVSVRKVIHKSRARCLMISAAELPKAVRLWEGENYDAQTGDGFGQEQIEARIDELFASVG